MQTGTQVAQVSKGKLWAGRIMSGLVAVFLILDSVLKLVKPAPVYEAFAKLGWPVSFANTLAVITLACVVIYVIPRTSVLGAILLTGYLGGAIATHVRVGDRLFTHALFPVYLSILM